MPVVRLYYEDMERLIGASRDTIMCKLAMMGADIGKRAEEEHVDVDSSRIGQISTAPRA